MGQYPVLSSGSPIFQQNVPKYPIFGDPLRFLDVPGAQEGVEKHV